MIILAQLLMLICNRFYLLIKTNLSKIKQICHRELAKELLISLRRFNREFLRKLPMTVQEFYKFLNFHKKGKKTNAL